MTEHRIYYIFSVLIRQELFPRLLIRFADGKPEPWLPHNSSAAIERRAFARRWSHRVRL